MVKRRWALLESNPPRNSQLERKRFLTPFSPLTEDETAELELATDEALGRIEPPPKRKGTFSFPKT